MSHVAKEFAAKYPYLFPLNEALDEYYGYIELSNGKTSEFSIKVPNYPMATNCVVDVQEDTITIDKIHDIDSSNLSIIEYLDKISYILSVSRARYQSSWKNFGLAYNNLIEELINFHQDPLGTSKWSFHLKDSSKVCMSTVDDYSQKHQLTIDINLNATNEQFYVVSHHNLPQSANDLLKSGSFDSLKSIYIKFNQGLTFLENFFMAMKTLDDMCWILDPKQPNGSENYRVIVAAEHGDDKVYMTVTLNAWQMDRAPDIRLCGHESLVKTLNEHMKENMIDNSWWNHHDVLTSLLRLLNVPFFPTAPVNDTAAPNTCDEQDTYECAICYLSFDNQIPIACTAKCKSYYHADCLCTWFRSSNGILCFNTLYQGPCPNCEEDISCPISSKEDFFERVSSI